MTQSSPSTDRGSAVAELVMVGGLLVLLLAGVVQAGLVLHARNVFASAAAEGARYAASTGSDEQAGARRTDDLARSALSDAVVRDVDCQSGSEQRSGLDVRVVTCDGFLPVLFLPFGRIRIHVAGRALAEPGP